MKQQQQECQQMQQRKQQGQWALHQEEAGPSMRSSPMGI